jgi:hypothetical protein
MMPSRESTGSPQLAEIPLIIWSQRRDEERADSIRSTRAMGAEARSGPARYSRCRGRLWGGGFSVARMRTASAHGPGGYPRHGRCGRPSR